MRRTLWATAIIVAVTVALVAALAPRDDDSHVSASSSRRATTTLASTAPTTAAVATTSSTTQPRRPALPVTLAFGGDVHFEGVLRPQLLTNADGMLAPIAPALLRADIAMVNLETAITERGTAQPKQFVFRSPPLAFRALRAAGVDVVTMANNHGEDYGPVGLADSIAAARAARFPVVGIGADEDEAYAPHWFTVRGQRIAVLGATQVLDDALIDAWTAGPQHPGLASAKRVDRLVAAVQVARAHADTVVVYVHWGTENATCPQDRQRTLADALVRAGADVVVGSHAHRVQGAGRAPGTSAFVDYGLGNFVFYASGGPAATSGVLTVTVTGRHVDSYGWTPAGIESGVPHPLTGAGAQSAVAAWQRLRDCTGLAP